MMNLKTAALLAMLATLLGACSSTPLATPTPTPTPAAKPMAALPVPAPPPQQLAALQPTPVSTVASVSLPPYLDPKSEISTARSVYFDFDASLVKPEFSGVIEHHGKYLVSNPRLAIKIEGNTDERGSAEYNLALGQKRAQAVMRALEIYGVKDAQMEAIS